MPPPIMSVEASYLDSADEQLSVMVNMTEALLNMTLSQTASPAEMPAPTEDPAYIYQLVQQLSWFRFLIQKIFMPIVISFGVTGNVMNIAVLTRRWMKSSTNYYLTALAFSDIFYLLFAFTLSLKHYAAIDNTYAYTRYYYTFGRPLADTCSNIGVWLTLTFTVERYIGVCHPMKGKRWCTPERARWIIIAVATTAAVLTFPEFFEREIIEKSKNNITDYTFKTTSFGSTTSYQMGYNYMNQGLFTFMPLILLLVFNSLLIRAVLNAAKKRKTLACKNDKSERQQKDQQKITIMLISVVIVFLLCQLPQAIQKIYITYLMIAQQMTTSIGLKLRCSANIFNLLVMLNSSLNFVLYSSFSTKFRGTFHRMFCRCLDRDMGGQQVVFSEAASAHPSPPQGSRAALVVKSLRSKQASFSYSTCTTTASQDFGSSKSLTRTVHPQRCKNGYLEVEQNCDL